MRFTESDNALVVELLVDTIVSEAIASRRAGSIPAEGTIIQFQSCPCGEIARRSRLKICRPQAVRVGLPPGAPNIQRSLNSVGRVPSLQVGCRRFDSVSDYHQNPRGTKPVGRCQQNKNTSGRNVLLEDWLSLVKSTRPLSGSPIRGTQVQILHLPPTIKLRVAQPG